MDTRLGSVLDFAARLQAKYDHPATPRQFARAAGILFLPSDEDSANAGPPAVVTYNARFGVNPYHPRSWHEIAHVLMGWHGIDQDFDYWPDEVDGDILREQTADLLAAQLMVPRPMMRAALKRYGRTGAAIAELQARTGLPEAVCLRRFAYDDVNMSCAAAVFCGSQVIDVTANNYRLPFWQYSRVPEPGQLGDGVRLYQVKKSRVIAVWDGY